MEESLQMKLHPSFFLLFAFPLLSFPLLFSPLLSSPLFSFYSPFFCSRLLSFIFLSSPLFSFILLFSSFPLSFRSSLFVLSSSLRLSSSLLCSFFLIHLFKLHPISSQFLASRLITSHFLISPPGETDLTGLNLDEIIFFRRQEVQVYVDEDNKPEVGSGLNKPAEVTLDSVYPSDKTTRQKITGASIGFLLLS